MVKFCYVIFIQYLLTFVAILSFKQICKINNMNLRNLIFFSLALIFMACNANKGGLTIIGTLKNAENTTAFFDKLSMDNTNEIILSTPVDGAGKFKINFPQSFPSGLYRIRVGVKSIDFVMDGTESEVIIDGDLNTIEQMDTKIIGSKPMEIFATIIADLKAEKLTTAQLMEMAKTHENPLVSFLIASKLFTFRSEFADLHTSISKRLKEKYPNDNWVDDYTAVAYDLEKEKARMMATSLIQVGMEAPEIALQDVKGKVRKLSDLRGKAVLLDFWASWCGPCRVANPHVVELYNKYNSKGFEVFSVSLDGLDNRTRQSLGDNSQVQMNLDRQKERWLDAIESDNLKWDWHVSDLMKWDSQAASTYGVTAIPKTFMVGKDGKITAIDPRYNLEEAILGAL